ncbi:MAG: acyltransferase [Holophagaceae bacterium]|nr:acyltransferase [Holophagaceae bacterium]
MAALAVMWFHFTCGGTLFDDGGILSSFLKASGRYGWAGVELFFVISGFVLPYALHRGAYRLRDYGTFWAKRIIRLEPPYLISLAIALGFWLLAAQFSAYKGPAFIVEWPRLLLHLGYLNHYFGKESYNPVYWTLAIELQFYLSIALLFPLLTHRHRLVRLAVPVALLALAWFPWGSSPCSSTFPCSSGESPPSNFSQARSSGGNGLPSCCSPGHVPSCCSRLRRPSQGR